MAGLVTVVVDDHEVVARGFEAVLRPDRGFEVVAVLAGPDELLSELEQLAPDLLVVNAGLPGGAGGLCAQARARRPGVRCLLYGSRPEDRAVMEASRIGCGGLVLTSSPIDRLVTAARLVAAGEPYLDPAVTRRLFEQVRAPEREDPAARLTPGERELLGHLVVGRSNREIAALMYLSEKTVKNYVSRLVRKLGVRRRGDLVGYGSVLDPPPGSLEPPVAV